MATERTKTDGGPRSDPEELARRFIALTARTQLLAQDLAQRQARQAAGQEFSLVDPAGVSRAFLEASLRLMADPLKLARAQMALWHDSMTLWRGVLGGTAEAQAGGAAPAAAAPVDRRFKDPVWSENVAFDFLRRSYLLTAHWMEDLVDSIEGLDPKTKAKVKFYTRQYLSALSPANYPLTNPQVLREIEKTGGENLLKGLENLLDDLERGGGRLRISMTDEAGFELGKNVALTPGKVIYQNDLMQLIQYAPSTEQVYKRPLLFVPPWINKYYVLDLQPKNSLIKWTVDQGHTLFVISWVNPRQDLAHKNFEDYMHEGPLAALDAIEQATGEREVNILGFCIGGILSTCTLAYLAAKGLDRIKAATLLATIVDFTDVGEASVFIDEDQLAAMEKHMASKGYLEGQHMADMFSMMREKDLIWFFVENNYLLGRGPRPFDLLFWNADSTRLPSAMLLWYLRHMYMENALQKPGAITLDGVPIDVGAIKTPCYALATREDHIAPWRSTYPATRAFGGPVRFVLGGSGHIAGIINPPSSTKYGYWTNPKNAPDPDAWLEGATKHEGSWWPDWGKWLAQKAGRKVPAREPGGGKLKPIEDAPGSYVRERGSE